MLIALSGKLAVFNDLKEDLENNKAITHNSVEAR